MEKLRHFIFITLILIATQINVPVATAHPLGNFTINLYSRLTVGAERIDILYVVNMAEIPTYQELGSAELNQQDQAVYLARKAIDLRDGLQLLVDGRKRALSITSQALSFPSGQGGLATTRIQLQFTASLSKLPAGMQRAITYQDTNYPDRLGWHEVVMRSTSGVRLVRSDVPTHDLSDQLRVYPQDMLSSPPDVRTAQVLVEPGLSPSAVERPAEQPATAQSTDRFAALITTEQLSPLILLLTLVAALGLGALHALSPGHGKAIVGAYLIGARGTARHALCLGLTVTATHTIGVFTLGFVTLFASRYILPEQLYPWLSMLSGGIVVVMGLTLLWQRLRIARGTHSVALHHHDHSHPHAHDNVDHHHDHNDGHGHDHSQIHGHGHPHDDHHSHSLHTHTHLPPGANGAPITWRSLLALGISGGLIPCPSALVVMLSAISLGRVGFGLLLIVAFSLGLAGVLTGIGLLFVHGGRWLTRISHKHERERIRSGMLLLPVASATVMTIAGLVITVQALAQACLLG